MTRFAKKVPRQPEEATKWEDLKASGTAPQRKRGVPEVDFIAAKTVLRNEQRRQRRVRQRAFEQRCFNCREFGHVLEDCPSASEKGAGQCYRCGSSSHTSKQCSKPGFGFARCFVCNESGHLSASCPQNENGLYPDGGACKYCNSKLHLAKNCKPLKQDSEITLSGDTRSALSADTDDALDAQKRIKKDSNDRKHRLEGSDQSQQKTKKVVKF